MTIFNLKKVLSRPLLVGSAAFLLYSGAVMAADREGDGQAQARELLAGTAKRSAGFATSAPLPAGIFQPALDPQEQARRLILGTPRTETPIRNAALDVKATSATGAERRGVRRAFPDGQALAERMIRGTAG